MKSIFNRRNAVKPQKLGGYAAILFLCWCVAFGIMTLPLLRYDLSVTEGLSDPIKMMAIYQNESITFNMLDLLHIPMGILILIVVLALHDLMKANTPNLMRLAVIAISISAALFLTMGVTGYFGYPIITEAKDISAFRVLQVMRACFGQAGINALGWTMLLIGWAILKTHALSRFLGCLIIVNGLFGISQFIVTQLENVNYLLLFINMAWLAIVLIRNRKLSME